MKDLAWTRAAPPRTVRGVYVIHDAPRVQYVGEGLVADRIAEWDGFGCIWAAVQSRSERLGIERYLIRIHEPPYNDTKGAEVQEVPVLHPNGVPMTEEAAVRLLVDGEEALERA